MEFGLQECMQNIKCHGKRAKGVLAFMPWMRKKASYADNVCRIEENMAGGGGCITAASLSQRHCPSHPYGFPVCQDRSLIRSEGAYYFIVL